jgi:hypothetical protein
MMLSRAASSRSGVSFKRLKILARGCFVWLPISGSTASGASAKKPPPRTTGSSGASSRPCANSRLGPTTGAIKAALHRGRGKLAERDPVERGVVSSAVLDAFCDVQRARYRTPGRFDARRRPRPDTGIERREYRDESVLVCWYDHDDGPVVRDILRVRTEGDRVVSIRYHFFSPDVLADVCGELGVPWRSNGYRYWPLDK